MLQHSTTTTPHNLATFNNNKITYIRLRRLTCWPWRSTILYLARKFYIPFHNSIFSSTFPYFPPSTRDLFIDLIESPKIDHYIATSSVSISSAFQACSLHPTTQVETSASKRGSTIFEHSLAFCVYIIYIGVGGGG